MGLVKSARAAMTSVMGSLISAQDPMEQARGLVASIYENCGAQAVRGS